MAMIVYESDNFQIIAPEKPHVSRTDGGHLVVAPKVDVEDRTKLSMPLAVEMMKLTMIAGEALQTVLNAHGVKVGRINYQDNGNWTPHLHIHLYGRAEGAVLQPYGTPLSFPSTKAEMLETMGNLEPLSSNDITALQSNILELLGSDKYKSF